MQQKHCCVVCKRNTVKLYRYYGSFLREDEIYCRGCAPAGFLDSGFTVPLVEDTDGSVWGYTSAPDDAVKRFEALPD